MPATRREGSVGSDGESVGGGSGSDGEGGGGRLPGDEAIAASLRAGSRIGVSGPADLDMSGSGRYRPGSWEHCKVKSVSLRVVRSRVALGLLFSCLC
jgi:hypothetical protein